MSALPILVISPSTLFNNMMVFLLQRLSNFSSTISCQPSKALATIRDTKPQQVIVDIALTDFSALNLLHKIHKQYRHIKIIVISENLSPAYLAQLFKIKISACLSKYCSVQDIEKAITKKEEKKIFCDQVVLQRLPLLHDRKLKKINSLTRQEFQIVVMLAHGIKTQEISKQLHLSIKTISSYHTQILNKLELNHNIEIVQFIHHHQMLSLPMRYSAFLH